MRFIFTIIFLIYLSYEQAPKSRHTILQINDGQVMAPGTLANLENFNYDILVRDYIGADQMTGVSKYS